MNKLLTKISTLFAGTALAVGVGIALSRDEVKEAKASTQTYSVADVVSNTGYNVYSNSTAVVTFGGNNVSMGTNSGNRSSCKLGTTYSKYAVSPVTTNSTASAFGLKNSVSNVNGITITYSGGSNQSSTVYLIYSSNDTTYSQISLTNGTQGSDLDSSMSFSFNKISGYFALVLVAKNTSGAWRIDNVTMTLNIDDSIEQSISGNSEVYVTEDIQLTTNAPSANWSITSGSSYAEFKSGVSTGQSVTLTGVAPGNVTVKAEATGYTDATHTFEVKAQPTAPLIVASPSSLEGYTGDNKSVTLTGYNVTLDETSITCDSDILTLSDKSSTGFSVHMNTAGTTNVVVKDNNSDYSINVPVTITASEVTKVTLDQHSLALAPTDSIQLHADVTYVGNVEPVHWESDATGVATVDSDGTVHAVAVGTAVITASTGGQSDTCVVSVSTKIVYTFGDTPTTASAAGPIYTTYGFTGFSDEEYVYPKADEAVKMSSSSKNGHFTYTLADTTKYITGLEMSVKGYESYSRITVTPSGGTAKEYTLGQQESFTSYTFNNFDAADQFSSFRVDATNRLHIASMTVYTADKAVLVNSITLDPTSLTIKDDDLIAHTVNVTISPDNPEDNTLDITVVDESDIIDVNKTTLHGNESFTVTGKGESSGTATITVSSKDGNATKSMTVTAKSSTEPELDYITFSGDPVSPQYDGHIFDATGLTFTGHYTFGGADQTLPVSEFTLPTLEFGEDVVLTHTETGKQVTITGFVVSANTLTITASEGTFKKDYKTTEQWDYSGIVASGQFADGTEYTGTFDYTPSIASPSVMGVGDNQDLTIRVTAHERSEYADVTVKVNISTYANTYGIGGDYFINISGQYAGKAPSSSSKAISVSEDVTDAGVYTFEIVGDDTFNIKIDGKFVYASNSNDGVRVGSSIPSGSSANWTAVTASEQFRLKVRPSTSDRYLARNSSTDVRTYTSFKPAGTDVCIIGLEPAVAFDSLQIDATSAKTNYYVNDELDPTGLVIKGVVGGVTSTTTIPTNKCTYSVNKFTAPGDDVTITVSYTNYDSSVATGTFTVDVLAEEVTSLTLSGTYKTRYVLGESLDTSGLVVTANLNSGRSNTLESTQYEVTGDISSVGSKTVTVTYLADTSISTTYEVTVVSESSIRIKTEATYKVFDIGEIFTAQGLKVEVVYSDDQARELSSSEYSISDVDTSTGGNKPVTITYGTFDISYDIFVRTQTGIKVDELPTKTTYVVGDKFTEAGIWVVNTYDNDDEVLTNDYELSIAENYQFTEADIGKKTVTVTQGSFTDTFEITINEKPVEPVLKSLEVTHMPNKTTYYQGEDSTNWQAGLEITAHYYDGDDKIVTSECNIGSFSTQTDGIRTISATYSEKGITKSCTFDLTVLKVGLESISIKTPASKVQFKLGDSFEATGLVVTASFSNGTTQDIPASQLQFSGYNMNVEGQQTVVVSYTVDGITKTTSYQITVSKNGDVPVDPTPGSKGNRINTGAIIGIAVGGAVLLAGLGVGIYFMVRKKKAK